METHETNQRKHSGTAPGSGTNRLLTDGGQTLPEGYERKAPREPAKLREGEAPDVSAHTIVNLSAIKAHERQGEFSEGTFERAAERHGVDPEAVPDREDINDDLLEAAR